MEPQPESPSSRSQAQSIRDTITSELSTVGIKMCIPLRRFIQNLDFEHQVTVKFNKRFRKIVKIMSAIILAMKQMEPTTLALAIDSSIELPEIELHERIMRRALQYTILTEVSLTEKYEGELIQNPHCLLSCFSALMAPSIKSLRSVKLSLHSSEVTAEILHQLGSQKLETLHVLLRDNLEQQRAAMMKMDFSDIREIQFDQEKPSNLHLADVLVIIAGRCPKLERLSLDISCPDRLDEVVDYLQTFPNLERLQFGQRINFTPNQLVALYKSNLFLIGLTLKDSNQMGSAVLEVLFLFLLRKFNYNRLVPILDKIQSSLSRDLREEDVLNLLEYIPLSYI